MWTNYTRQMVDSWHQHRRDNQLQSLERHRQSQSMNVYHTYMFIDTTKKQCLS